MPIPDTPISDLTTTTLTGPGSFDVLMRAVKKHLDEQFLAGRIKGPEYAQVYLGSLDLAMQNGMAFLAQIRKVGRELELLDKQILLADKALAKADAEIAQITAQTALLGQQRLNAVTENTVLVAQECKLRAEFDLTVANKLRVDEETALLAQKTATERAQTQDLGVSDNSVIGKQKKLYQAQTDGFTRDAEQKVAKIMADSWSVRRTTDEGTVADGTNSLNDASVGRAINKLLAGVGA